MRRAEDVRGREKWSGEVRRCQKRMKREEDRRGEERGGQERVVCVCAYVHEYTFMLILISPPSSSRKSWLL